MGYYCDNGIVIAADKQGTSGTEVSEIQKVFRFSPTGLIAFSGNDYTWIKEFMSFVSKEKGRDIDSVRAAIAKYERYVEDRFGRRPPELVDFAGILATNEDKEPKMWEFGFWKGFDDAAEAGRIIIGSAATQAKTFIRIAEEFQRRMEYPPWRSLSTELVTWWCYLLLSALPTYDSTVHGAQVINVWSRLEKGNGTIFDIPTKVVGPKDVEQFTHVLFKHVQKEVPLQDILKALSSYQLLNDDLFRLLSDYSRKEGGWWGSY